MVQKGNRAQKSRSTAEVSLKNRIHRNISMMTFKCVNNLAPLYLQDRFSLVKDIHEKNTTIMDKIRWDTLPYGREKAASSPFPPFQCCSYVVKSFDIHVDLQH